MRSSEVAGYPFPPIYAFASYSLYAQVPCPAKQLATKPAALTTYPFHLYTLPFLLVVRPGAVSRDAAGGQAGGSDHLPFPPIYALPTYLW